MNESQKFLQKYNVEWPRLKEAGSNITAKDVPSDQEVAVVFNEYMYRELAGVPH
jgi:hypothetical protein